MKPCGDHNDFPVQKHLPFWYEKALNVTKRYFGSGRGWVGADANFIATVACLSLPENSGSFAQAKLSSQG